MNTGGHFDDLETAPTTRGFAAGQLLFGRYKLEKLLGRGGMGVVWLAEDRELEERVALKVLPDAVRCDPTALSELKEETRRSRKLAHRNIVRVHDFVSDERCAALSMEWIDGSTLAALRLKRPRMVFEPEELGPWIRQVCEALEHAHTEARVVHRDLKPANLMLHRNGEIKVADFGISGALSDVARAQPVGGTLYYTSPQQAGGAPPAIADDIYALGATIYELLTGKPPFFHGDLLAEVREAVPPPIRVRRSDLGVRSPVSIPPEWERTVAACLEKDPDKRPQSAFDVARGLGVATPAPVKPSGPPVVPPPLPPEAFQKPQPDPEATPLLARKGVRFALGTVLLLLLICFWPRCDKRLPQGAVAARGVPEGPRGGGLATKEAPWANSLGMKFVPVPAAGVLFSIWDTRVRDFEVFANETGFGAPTDVVSLVFNAENRKEELKKVGTSWKEPGFTRSPEHPVAGVSWLDAKAFCKWLTERERKSGVLEPDQEYRLPTDEEWSIAAGATARYPWGDHWPPPTSFANYRGEECKERNGGYISGFTDGYMATAPVGQFAANAFGLFDMAGNVWQWCEDIYRAGMNDDVLLEQLPEYRTEPDEKGYRTLRGGSYLTVVRLKLRSSSRERSEPDRRFALYGFRCVLTPPASLRHRLEPAAAQGHEGFVQSENLRHEVRKRPVVFSVPGDFPNIQEAIDECKAGDTVSVQPGAYNEALLFRTGITLAGAGAKSVKVRSNVDWFVLNCSRCLSGTVSGITFEQVGTTTRTLRYSVILVENSAVEIAKCRIQNGGGTGVYILNSAPRIVGCLVAGSDWDGIVVSGTASRPWLYGNTMSKNNWNGIVFSGGARGTAKTNLLEENGIAGIDVSEAGTAPSLVGTESRNNKITGIRFRRGAQENTCWNNGGSGIGVIDPKTQPLLIQNKCFENRNTGIFFGAGAGGSAVGNECSKNLLDGIQVGNAYTSPVFKNNQLSGNKRFGIAADRRSVPRGLEQNAFSGNGVAPINRSLMFNP